MKCRVGDVAVVIRSQAGNLGKLVTCVRLATPEDFAGEGVPPCSHGPYWVLDRDLVVIFELGFTDGRVARFLESTRLYPDANLHPIRDPGDDAVDESLVWSIVPELDCA